MRRNQILIGLALVFVLAGGSALAETNAAPAAAGKTSLAATGVGIAALQEVAGKGIITGSQSGEGVQYLLKQAAQTIGHPVTAEEALAARDTLGAALGTVPAKKGGVTFVEVLLVLAIIGVVFCLAVLFGPLLIKIPPVAYEAVFYVAAAAIFFFPFYGHMAANMLPYAGFMGCLVLGAGLAFTFKAHKIKFTGTSFSLPLFVAWSIAAIVFKSSLIGFFAVAALMSALGFSVLAVPGCVIIGFEGDAKIARATTTAFVILIIFTALHAFGMSPPHISVFKVGALYFGSFVGYLGLLITSSKWYTKKNHNYIVMQVVTVVLGLAALCFGTQFGLPELQKIGGTFFAFYLVEKTFEIPKKSIFGYAAVGAFSSSVIIALCWYIMAHAETFRPYIFFV